MPSITEFLGMWITINWNGHNPPHFHIRAGEYDAIMRIDNGTLIAGYLPLGKLNPLAKWAKLHQSALMDNWQRAQDGQSLQWIEA